jgi:hypothetical protein
VTLVQKVSETRRLLSSTIEYLDAAKRMVECHNARKTMEDAIEDAQEAAQVEDLAEVDFSYCRLMAGTMTFRQLIRGKKNISHPEDMTMLREAEEALERLHDWRLALRRAQQLRGRRARCSHRSSPHALTAKKAPLEGIQRREASRAGIQSKPEAHASCARGMQNGENEMGKNEGSEESRGAVQDSTEESYEPRQKFDAPARESRSRGAKIEAKVAPAAREVAASADGYKRRRQQDFRNKPEPSPEGLTGGCSEPSLADNEPPDEGGGGPVNQLPQRQESSTWKVVGCDFPH